MAGGKLPLTVFCRLSIASRYFDGFSIKQLNGNLGQLIGARIYIPYLIVFG